MHGVCWKRGIIIENVDIEIEYAHIYVCVCVCVSVLACAEKSVGTTG